MQEISTEIQHTAKGSNIIVSAATEEQSASIEEIAASSQMLSKMVRESEMSLTKFTV